MFFTKIAKIVVVFLFMALSSVEVDARGNGGVNFDWNPLMDAITEVESGGDARATNGGCCGAMQISTICVRECNVILQSRGEKKRYTLKDRFNVKKSREMFVLIMSKYNPTNNIELAIRLWNGGVHYSVRATQHYYQKVMAQLKK